MREVLIEGLDDWVPVDRVIGLVRESQDFQSADFKTAIVQVIESLLRQGLVTVGVIGDNGFEPWLGDVGHILAALVKGLDKVDWMPFGGLCWLANTQDGDRLVSTWIETEKP